MKSTTRGRFILLKLARKAGVKRFVYMSSCSVYGVAEGEDVTEESSVDPQTAYAICKTLVERDVKPLARKGFSPVFMRNATAYGASPRMRFDIVLNNLAGLAWTTKEIKMTSDGTPWRPLVHGLDIARAIIAVLQAPTEAIHNEVFNVGDTSHNYRVREIAETVGQRLSRLPGIVWATKRGQSELPGFLRKDSQASAQDSNASGTRAAARNNFTIFSNELT